ncbi:hypothetical protein IWQ62_005410 [Dispira parvispora]|uniref:CCHC-type domain-containing protein n=1 Tax=Dispira parvispora TaxID=1520584 RepID=A0A9W8E4J4_9FUNG|nr:hypothetical protein IWQ62_005410 [Dispira parvispora]
MEYWAEVSHDERDEKPRSETPKPESETVPKTETPTDVNQMMERFERMTLNLLRIAENNQKRPTKENWTRNCFYCNSPGHRKYDCADYAKDKTDGLFTVDERGKIFDRQGNFVRIDAEKGMMHHIRSQRGKSNLVRGVSISPEAATFAVKAVLPEEIEVPTEWDCPVVVDGVTYQVKRPREEDAAPGKKLIVEREPMQEVYVTNEKENREETKNTRKTSHEYEKERKYAYAADHEGKRGKSAAQEKENYSGENGKSGGFELDPEIRNVVEQVKEAEVRLTLEELAQISPMARRGVQSVLRPKKTTVPRARVGQAEAHSEQEEETAWKDILYASGLGTVDGTLAGRKTRFTLDDGSEMNLMASDVAEELAQQGKLTIRKDVVWSVTDINGGTSSTKGVSTYCQVGIGDATIPGHFFVTGQEKGLVLLGAPWQRAARLEKRHSQDGAVWIRIRDYQTDALVQFCAVAPNHPRKCADPVMGPRKSYYTRSSVEAVVDPIGLWRELEPLETKSGSTLCSIS